MRCQRFLSWLDNANAACMLMALACLVLGVVAAASPGYRLPIFDEDMWFYMTTLCFAGFALFVLSGVILYILSVLLSAFFCQCGWIKEQSIPHYH